MVEVDLVSLFGSLGFISSQLMNISSIPSVIHIHRAGSTLSYPSFPAVVGITNSIHNILYASSRSNWFVIYSSTISFLLNSAFLAVHYKHSKSRSSILNLLSYFSGISVLIAILMIHFAGGVPEARPGLGALSTAISTLSYGGQLSTVRSVIARKDSSSISPWMTAGVLVRALCWFIYAYLTSDWYYLTSTSFGLTSAAVQIVLLLQYPAYVQGSRQKLHSKKIE